jgi:hypothetical protein
MGDGTRREAQGSRRFRDLHGVGSDVIFNIVLQGAPHAIRIHYTFFDEVHGTYGGQRWAHSSNPRTLDVPKTLG